MLDGGTAVAETMTALTDAATTAAEMTATAAPEAVQVVQAAMSTGDLLAWFLGLVSVVVTALLPVVVRWVWIKTGLDKTEGAEAKRILMEAIARDAVLAAEEKAHRAGLSQPSLAGADKLAHAKKVARVILEQLGVVRWADAKLEELIHAQVNEQRHWRESKPIASSDEGDPSATVVSEPDEE